MDVDDHIPSVRFHDAGCLDNGQFPHSVVFDAGEVDESPRSVEDRHVGTNNASIGSSVDKASSFHALHCPLVNGIANIVGALLDSIVPCTSLFALVALALSSGRQPLGGVACCPAIAWCWLLRRAWSVRSINRPPYQKSVRSSSQMA